MFGKKFIGGAALSTLAIAISGAAYAQETTSAIRGEVISETGAPVAGANVSVTHTPTGTVIQDVTNAEGIVDARGLRVGGPYTIEVTANGFESRSFDNVFLTVGEPLRFTIDLFSVGSGVTVTASRPTSAAAGVGSSTLLNRDAIDAVVSVNRDIRDLARRDPLVTQNARGDGGISIAGSNPRTNRITIDGGQAQDDFGLNTGGFPTRRGPVSIDAIEQFAVEAVPFDVENGDFLGGAINVVLAQGENDFSGSVFVNYLNEGLGGTRLGTQGNLFNGTTQVRQRITQENWGGTFRGPILKDRLFFALSYETFESSDLTATGPAGLGFGGNITGPTGSAMTQAQIDAVTNVFRTTYGSTFPVGSIPLSQPITDEKYTARLDWNITDNHRASLTYRSAESGLIQRTNLGGTSAGLSSQWYLTGEEDQAISLQLNSDWTPNFSTEVRILSRDYTRLQEPPSGQTFADIRVCSTATSLDTSGTAAEQLLNCRNGATNVAVVRFGPDQFRHANFLETGNRQAQFSGEYELNNHVIKAGVQWQREEVFNLFVPQSDGVYYFDSIADFTAGRSNELVYRNALSGRPTDAAADFVYDVFSTFLQDTWYVNDRLTVTGGFRWDVYTGSDSPVLNTSFRNRYGFTNQQSYDGLDVFMPRFSFDYDLTDAVEITGGIGLFSGGLPGVFLSNSFSNTGAIDNSIRIIRNADGTFSETTGAAGFTQAIGAAALNVPVNSTFGQASAFPAAVQSFLAGVGASPTAETNSLSPTFEVPSQWKANVSLKWEDAFRGWDLGTDLVVVREQQGLAFRDLRAQPLIRGGVLQRTPDGRIRYDGLSTAQRAAVTGVTSTNPGTNRDIQAFNPENALNGYNYALALSAANEWESGLSVGVAYTQQRIEEYSSGARFSSTASSLYGGQFADRDPNRAAIGRGQEEIENAFKVDLGFRRNFIADLETRFTLFGEWRSGRPVTPTMNAGSGRNATFGVNRGSQIAYIPGVNDPRVVYDSSATQASVDAIIQRFGLPRGQIADRGAFNNPDIAQADFQFSQELPGLLSGHRTVFQIDVQNVLNLLNDEWGLVEEWGESVNLFDVSCAGVDGVADADGVATCETYRVSAPNTDLLRRDRNFGKAVNPSESLWFAQVSLRYKF